MKTFKEIPAIILLLVCLSSAAIAQIVVQPPAETNLKQIKAFERQKKAGLAIMITGVVARAALLTINNREPVYVYTATAVAVGGFVVRLDAISNLKRLKKRQYELRK